MVVSSKNLSIEIDRERIFSEIGYDNGGQPPARVLSLVDEYIENAGELIDPSYSYVIEDVQVVHGSRVLVGKNVVFNSEIVARLLKRCKKVAVSVVTIGSYLEGTARRLAKDGHLLQASVLDAIGSQAVHKAAEHVQNEIQSWSRTKGLEVSRRFSPGYCDWDIGQQLMVFRAVGRDTTGVHLTDTCVMIPSKSISGIVGIGSAKDGIGEYNPCGICEKDSCAGRR